MTDARMRGHTNASEVLMNTKIRELRHRQGMSQKMLAARCGSDREWLSRLESGRHAPTLSTLQRVATALGVPLVDLLPSECHRYVKA